MKDDYFNELVPQWLEAFEVTPKDGLQRLLMMFAKEVSRDTRHHCADIAQAAFRDIFNS